MNKEIKRGVILQYIQMGLSVIISLIYTPLMLRILGKSEYGLYNISASIISYLSILSLGFGSSYVRYYFIKKKEDSEKIKNLNGLYLFIFLIFGFIALIVGTILSQNVRIFLNKTYTSKEVYTASILMIILTINLAISFPMSLFVNYLTSQEKFTTQKILNIGKTVLAPALSVGALFLKYGSIGVVVCTTIVSFIIDIITIYYCVKKANMKISFKKMQFSLAKDIFVFSLFIAINQIIDQINWQTDKIILGKMINSTAVSVYAIGSIFNTYFTQFSISISSVFTPKINKIVQENPENKSELLTKTMIDVGRVQFFVLFLALSGFVFFGKLFIKKWAGDGFGESYIVAILLMCPAMIPLIQNIGIEIQRAENKHKFRSVVYLIMALINIGISIVLCKYYGVIGVTIGTTISLVLANGIIMNVYYQKKLNLDMKKFWIEILKIIPSFLIPIGVGTVIMIFETNIIWIYILEIIAYIIVYCVTVYFFGLNKQEKEYIKKYLKL